MSTTNKLTTEASTTEASTSTVRVPAGDLLLTEAEAYFDRSVKERRWTGRKTYGGGLEHRDSRYDWTRMALEEAMDLGQYLAARCRQLEDLLAEERAALAKAKESHRHDLGL